VVTHHTVRDSCVNLAIYFLASFFSVHPEAL
jgi:hypothetical protein